MQTSYTFQPSQFLPKPKSKRKGKSKNPAYLILGFDTEYQRETYQDADGVDQNRNQVLSYQYSCRIVTPDNEGIEPHWSGIILPKGTKDEDRISLKDFVKDALAAGLQEHPDLKIPYDIYLVAHFTRADVPAFRDFKNTTDRQNMSLENIRGLFMNVSQSISIDMEFQDETSNTVLDVQIRDTVALAPAGAQSLSRLGDILGFEKLKLSDDPDEELHFKKNMSRLLDTNFSLFKEYAIRDAEICSLYTTRIIRIYQEKTGKFKLPVTLTSIGVDMIQKYWESNGVDPLNIVGKEQVVEKKWDKRYERYQTTKKAVSLKKLFWNEDFFTECYHGGRNEQFWFGPAPDGVWYDYDLTSAYPSAMAIIGAPHWNTISSIGSTNELLTRFGPDDLAFANVDFEFPDNVKYPVLPVRTEHGLVFPRKGNSTTHISEILLAKHLGCKITLIEGRHLNCDRVISRTEEYAPAKRPFSGFARNCIVERSKHPKKSLDNLFWKELINSTYGKTAQGLRERRVYDLRDAGTKPLPPSKITNPVYAAFITAFCRGVLGEIMNNLPEQVQVFSVTTDGFLTTATNQQMRDVVHSGPLGQRYLDARRRIAGEWSIYEVKHIIRQPLGWRTRGQATIKPSQPDDWADTTFVPNDDDRHVLAKGGIQLHGSLSKPEQNAEVLKLFFNRRPEDTLTVKHGAGIREMYEKGTDFVDKTSIRRLSMEFDWKRRPNRADEVEVSIDGVFDGNHLAFATVPWDDIDQFNTTRAIWEQYNKEDRKCLKSLTDYHAFALYLESRLAGDGQAGKYLSKDDGILKRIRRDIVHAHKHRKAGTHKILTASFGRKGMSEDYVLKPAELANALQSGFGIPCTAQDVSNARRGKIFKPHQVPYCSQAVQTLKDIKAHLFPELDISQFLSSTAKFTIDVERGDLSVLPKDEVREALNQALAEIDEAILQ